MKLRAWITARLVTLARVYFTFLFGWVILHALFGDLWWLFYLTSASEFMFALLPGVAAIALLTRRRELFVGVIAAMLLAAFLFGGLFVPKFIPHDSSEPTLSVMTYNTLGIHDHPEQVVATIRAANADVVAIQELNPSASDAIRRELSGEYPYQILDPQEGVRGMGVISRYPLRATGETLPGDWVGAPQVLTLDWNGARITLLHFHTFPTNSLYVPLIIWSANERARQARAIADFAIAHPGALIAPGDFNATDQTAEYAVVTRELRDAWREAGWGLGHTFPSTSLNGNSLPALSAIHQPLWLLRIDYIFHSRQLQAVSAQMGPWDGYSDHRSVIAKFKLAK
jgi:endonuclease/exonuclease/phosphatase (EEP) superfamily protein YafD